MLHPMNPRPRSHHAADFARLRRRGDRVKRREFILLIGGAAAMPFAARAQQPAMPVIGVLLAESRDTQTPRFRAFHVGLNEAGFVEGRNVMIEYRSADGQSERWPALIADLVRRPVTAIAS